MNEENNRQCFVKKGDIWPEWGNFVVCMKGGYQFFEDENEYEKFLEEYREELKKNPVEETVYGTEEDSNDLPRTGKIGFKYSA